MKNSPSFHLSLTFQCVLPVKLFFVLLSAWVVSISAVAKDYPAVQWVDLIPKSDLDALLNPPQSLNNIAEGSEFDLIPKDPVANSVEKAIEDSIALRSTKINAEFNQKDIRIAGFVVPVEYNDDQVITEFFLVPYFGACIHVPPPPPNQIIYVKYPKGLSLEVLYDPFWIEGQILTEVVENDLALSAYTMEAKGVKTYDKYKP